MKRLLTLFLVFILSAAVYARIVNKIIVVVNDEVITQYDLENKLNPAVMRLFNEVRAVTADIKRETLNQLITERLIYQEAEKQEIQLSETYIRDIALGELQRIKGQFELQSDFEDALKESGLTEEKLIESYSREIEIAVLRNQLMGQLMQEKIKELDTTPYEYYIYIIQTSSYDIAKEAQIMLTKGLDFETTARYKSDGPEAQDGGDAGFVRLGSIHSVIERELIKMKEDSYSSILEFQGNYFIIYLKEKRKLKDLTAEETEIYKNQIMELKAFSIIKEWEESLWAENFVDIKDSF